MSDKRQLLLELAQLRQRTRWDGYHSLAEYHDGAYECDWVSPYSKTAGNVDANVFILLQDWSSHDYLSRPFNPKSADLGHTPNLPTNCNLKRLLHQTFNLGLEDVFGTNLFPFIKPGGISTRIQNKDLDRAALEFALPQVRIVKPTVVVCLGLATFNAIRRVCQLPACSRMDEAINSPFKFETSWIWCQAHTGSFGQNTRGREQVNADWQRMKAAVWQDK